MIEILPSIIPKTYAELEEQLERLKGVSALIHIDVCDGRFAPQASWPLAKTDQNFLAMVRQERGMPYWEDVDFEFHLMVDDPFQYIPDFIAIGASRIVIHAESINLENDRLLLDQLRSDGAVSLGIAFNIDTPLEHVESLLSFADFVQFMSIDHIGKQGESFDTRVLERIQWLSRELPTMPIQVDGGITPETIGACFDAGANRFVSGSYVLKSVSPVHAVQELQEVVE